MSSLVACLDANVMISAIAFGGAPLKVVDLALSREFDLVMSPHLVSEVQRNLVQKLGLTKRDVDLVLDDLCAIASIYVPTGQQHYINHEPDNLVLELALMGQCDVLVTGDKRHLLPLSPFRELIIEPPSRFLKRLGAR